MTDTLRVLVACEFSGVVRRAFVEHGHDAWSCDLLPAEDRSNRHITGDVRNVLHDGWDMMMVAQGRSRHARPGEPVQLYTGMRTKHCRKLVDPDPVCLGVYDVSLNFVGPGCAWLDGEIISNLDAFARDDGFKGWSDMDGWWVETHATALFDGVLIRWGNR